MVLGGLLTLPKKPEHAPQPMNQVEVAGPTTERRPLPSPAELAILSRVENRLAIQASLAAHTGHCAAAIVTATQLAKTDPALYGELLAKDAELATCYESRP